MPSCPTAIHTVHTVFVRTCTSLNSFFLFFRLQYSCTSVVVVLQWNTEFKSVHKLLELNAPYISSRKEDKTCMPRLMSCFEYIFVLNFYIYSKLQLTWSYISIIYARIPNCVLYGVCSVTAWARTLVFLSHFTYPFVPVICV